MTAIAPAVNPARASADRDLIVRATRRLMNPDTAMGIAPRDMVSAMWAINTLLRGELVASVRNQARAELLAILEAR